RHKKDELRRIYGLGEKRILFWSARLVERKKGILNFLSAIQDLPFTVLLAGDGPDMPLVKQWAADHPEFDLRVYGHLEQDRLCELMAISDLAVLPSFSDPN